MAVRPVTELRRQGLCLYYSGWECVQKLTLTTKTLDHLQGVKSAGKSAQNHLSPEEIMFLLKPSDVFIKLQITFFRVERKGELKNSVFQNWLL
jgi:hypothetical protein